MKTSSNTTKKCLYYFMKSSCVGSLECRFENCKAFMRDRERNVSSWKGQPKVEKPYMPRSFINGGGIVCGHCESIPFCV